VSIFLASSHAACLHSLVSYRPLIPTLRDSLEAQRTLSFFSFFLSADPGGIGSAFHWAEEGRKEKTTSLRDIFAH